MAVSNVTVVLVEQSLTVGQTTMATATLRDAANNVLTGRVVNWATSNAAVATVTPAGLVTAVAPGNVTLTATSEGRSGSATLTVSPIPVASVVVVLAANGLTVGETTTATATVRDAASNVLTGRIVNWATSNPGVATVSSSGLVTAIAPGNVTLTATSEGRSGGAALTVSPIPVALVVVVLAANGLTIGDTTAAIATLRDAANNVLTGRIVNWATSDPRVATVSRAGLVTAVAPGSVTLTATSEGQSAASVLIVAPNQQASVVLAIDPAILPGIDRNLSQFMTDIASDRYRVLLHTIRETSPPQLRQAIKGYYDHLSPKLEGVIVIGGAPMPTATFAYPNPPGSKYSGPSMQYYMDLDGTFLFNAGQVGSEIDSHTGSVEIEIWASILPMHGSPSATIANINNYLAKNHKYRSGQIQVQKGFVKPVSGSQFSTEALYNLQYQIIRDQYYVQLARRGNFFVGIDNALGDLNKFPTSRVSYEREMMSDRYDVASIGAHGGYNAFGANTVWGGILIDLAFARTMPIKPIFLIEHSCNTAAIHVYPNLGSEFLYNKDNNVLVFAGATAPQGGMGDTSMGTAANYEASLLTSGASIGVAHFAPMRLPYVGFFAPFRDAFAAQQILLGDGTLRLQEFRR